MGSWDKHLPEWDEDINKQSHDTGEKDPRLVEVNKPESVPCDGRPTVCAVSFEVDPGVAGAVTSFYRCTIA